MVKRMEVNNQELIRIYGEYKKSIELLTNNMLSLRKRYGGEYIAIDHGEVVAHAETPDELKEKLEELGIDFKKP